jgi:hypothetical protein
VGVLRQTAEEAKAAAAASKPTGASALSSMTANPEMSKMVRDQQKLGMSIAFKGLEKRANLSKEKAEALHNALADEVMVNIEFVTKALLEGMSSAEIDAMFTRRETETDAKVREVLGSEEFEHYKGYTRDLASILTAEQFKSTLPGEKSRKDEVGREMLALMQEETRRALAERGLKAEHQLAPTLNFRNFASEEEGERNLQLLDTIYERVQARAGAFLSPEETEKFTEFRKMAVNNNRVALTVNRKLMSPGGEQK